MYFYYFWQLDPIFLTFAGKIEEKKWLVIWFFLRNLT